MSLVQWPFLLAVDRRRGLHCDDWEVVRGRARILADSSPGRKYERFATRPMILLTGATGVIGSALLQRLVGDGDEVRCLVRDPRRLGPNRVRVQITLGDLANPVALRQAVRGVRAVVHLAAAIRD